MKKTKLNPKAKIALLNNATEPLDLTSLYGQEPVCADLENEQETFGKQIQLLIKALHKMADAVCDKPRVTEAKKQLTQLATLLMDNSFYGDIPQVKNEIKVFLETLYAHYSTQNQKGNLDKSRYKSMFFHLNECIPGVHSRLAQAKDDVTSEATLGEWIYNARVMIVELIAAQWIKELNVVKTNEMHVAPHIKKILAKADDNIQFIEHEEDPHTNYTITKIYEKDHDLIIKHFHLLF
jgi:hypothetical protein